MASWAHSYVGHYGVSSAQALVDLGDVYDRPEFESRNEREVDAEVVAEAYAFLRATAPSH